MPDKSKNAKEGHQIKISKETHEQLIEMDQETDVGYKKLTELAVNYYFRDDSGFGELREVMN